MPSRVPAPPSDSAGAPPFWTLPLATLREALHATAAGLTTVKFGFDPLSGSGVDPKNNSLLKTTGTASGVGIGMFDADSHLINLSANETYVAPLIKTGEGQDAQYSATLNMRASYVANGNQLQPGTANGTLPFTLTYE